MNRPRLGLCDHWWVPARRPLPRAGDRAVTEACRPTRLQLAFLEDLSSCFRRLSRALRRFRFSVTRCTCPISISFCLLSWRKGADRHRTDTTRQDDSSGPGNDASPGGAGNRGLRSPMVPCTSGQVHVSAGALSEGGCDREHNNRRVALLCDREHNRNVAARACPEAYQ